MSEVIKKAEAIKSKLDRLKDFDRLIFGLKETGCIAVGRMVGWQVSFDRMDIKGELLEDITSILKAHKRKLEIELEELCGEV